MLRPQFVLQWQPLPLTVELLPLSLPVALLAAASLATPFLLALAAVAVWLFALGQRCHCHWLLPSSTGAALVAVAPTAVPGLAAASDELFAQPFQH